MNTQACTDMESARAMISTPYRMVFYAISAIYVEVIWTALYDLVSVGNWKLIGYSSIWSIPIYTTASAILEPFCLTLLRRQYGLIARGLVYMLCIFATELAFGLVLQYFEANSWDYSKQFVFHYRGLIALEYGPLWVFAGLFFEHNASLLRCISFAT